jgi:hypothetical protein
MNHNSIYFNFKQIENKFSVVLNNWLKLNHDAKNSMTLYFQVFYKMHLLEQFIFLSLTQCFENYSRSTSSTKEMNESDFEKFKDEVLESCPEKQRKRVKQCINHANEIGLRKRLKEIFNPIKIHIGNNRDQENLINKIIKTRNYLTHHDLKSKDEAINGLSLLNICDKMEAIFQLIFLKHLGLSEKEIKEIIDNEFNGLKHKLTLNI